MAPSQDKDTTIYRHLSSKNKHYDYTQKLQQDNIMPASSVAGAEERKWWQDQYDLCRRLWIKINNKKKENCDKSYQEPTNPSLTWTRNSKSEEDISSQNWICQEKIETNARITKFEEVEATKICQDCVKIKSNSPEAQKHSFQATELQANIK